jgi:hypothetical protein
VASAFRPDPLESARIGARLAHTRARIILNRMPTFEELQAMKEALWHLDGRTVIQEINALSRILKVFHGNARELRRFLGKFGDPPQALQLMDVHNQEGLDR